MRQKDDHSFAELLSRVRVKQKTDAVGADVEDGLVNGIFGTITNTGTSAQDRPKIVKLIGLKLDNQKLCKKIQGSSDNQIILRDTRNA